MITTRPLAIDLFCGLGGWTDGLLAEGYDVIGFDITQGDVPALMPVTFKAQKVPGFRFDGSGKSFQTASVQEHTKNNNGSWFNIGSPGQKVTGRNPVHELSGTKVPSEQGRRTDPRKGARFTSRDCGVEGGIKQAGDWFNASQPSISRLYGSKSPQRKMASAMIAKIPLPLSRYIAATFRPQIAEAAE